MLKYWPQIRKSTFFKLGVVTAISYVLYLMAGFLLPLLLAVGLAFALYPLVNAIAQVRMAHGMIKLSRVVAIILALMAFCIFIFMIIGFIIAALRADERVPAKAAGIGRQIQSSGFGQHA